MGKLKLEIRHCIKQDRLIDQEIVECGQEKIEEVRQIAFSSLDPFDIEAIDIDDIMALMECGKQYSVEELVEQFGISIDTVKALLAPHDFIDIPDVIAESENTGVIDSVFSNVDLHNSAEPFPLNGVVEFSDEELARMVYELEHAFD